MNVFAALGVLALLIVIHEAGHFFAATLQGIRVSGFSIGFGPALIKRQRRGVTYALRLLPLGRGDPTPVRWILSELSDGIGLLDLNEIVPGTPDLGCPSRDCVSHTVL